MVIYSIYKWTNLINGKVYIGKTKNPNDRRRDHIRNALTGKNTVFYQALRKYGIDNFSYEVIFVCFDERDLTEFEIMFIKEYKSCILEEKHHGYNMTYGGDGQTSASAKAVFDRLSKEGKGLINHSTRQAALKRVEENKNPWAGALGTAMNEKRIADGTHNMAGQNGVKFQQARLLNGTHQLLTVRTCPNCGKTGKGPNMIRWHMDNCRVERKT